MRSRTSEPGSIAQKRARSKSGPSGGTTTLKRVTASVPLKSPIVLYLLLLPAMPVERGGILADGRGRGGMGVRRSGGGRRRLGIVLRVGRRLPGRGRSGLGRGLWSGDRLLGRH